MGENAIKASTVIEGVMEIIEAECERSGTEKLSVCLVALGSVVKWLDEVAERES